MLGKSESRQQTLEEDILELKLEHKNKMEHMEKLLFSIEKTNNILNIFDKQGKTDSNVLDSFKYIRTKLEDDILHLKLCREMDAFSLKTLGSSLKNELIEFKNHCRNVLNEFKSRDNRFEHEITNLKVELSKISTELKADKTRQCNTQNQRKMMTHESSIKLPIDSTRTAINVYEKFTCQLCNFTFIDLEQLNSHIKEKEHGIGLNNYKCNICRIENFTLKGLSFHCSLSAPSLHHENIAKMIDKNIPQAITCHPCYVKLNDVESLKLHFQVKENASRLVCTCSFCNVELSNIRAAISHLKSDNYNCWKIFFDANDTLPKDLTL